MIVIPHSKTSKGGGGGGRADEVLSYIYEQNRGEGGGTGLNQTQKGFEKKPGGGGVAPYFYISNRAPAKCVTLGT